MTESPEHTVLGTPLELPCGAVLKNRIAKSAMSDSLGDGQGDPTAAQMRLYERWAEGGVAVSFIGEVQVDARYPEKPGNLALWWGSDTAKLRELARRARVGGAHLWPQLGHAGALAHPPISAPAGPSALDLDGLRCRALSTAEVEALPGQFANTARAAQATGFSGVHLHAGHGFLFSQFLSPLFNRRTDGYGGSIEARARIVLDTVAAVRDAVGPAFPVGLRLNSSDLLEGGLTEAESLEVVGMLDGTALDLIDVSGGTYFPGAASSSDAAGSGPYYVDYALRARARTRIPLMVTGGFKTRAQAVEAVGRGAADVVGVARAFAIDPSLAETWLGETGGDPGFPRFDGSPPPGGITAWYTQRLTAVGEDRDAAYDESLASALDAYDARDAARCDRWRALQARVAEAE
ncbi:MAG: oxidoreductase [Pseudomonadota bacterium]